MLTDKRKLLLGIGACVVGSPWLSRAVALPPTLPIYTSKKGSGFYLYGEGLAKIIGPQGLAIVLTEESNGSYENLQNVSVSTSPLGMTLVSLVYSPPHAEPKFQNVTALFPMYQTAFVFSALHGKDIASVSDLNSMHLGVGTPHGPLADWAADVFFDIGVRPFFVSGEPDDQLKQLRQGKLDAILQTIEVPTASRLHTDDIISFGFADKELSLMKRRQPFASEVTFARLNAGNGPPVKTYALWNAVIAHRAFSEEMAYRITKSVLGKPDLADAIGPLASQTKLGHAASNNVILYHRGAARALLEMGVEVQSD